MIVVLLKKEGMMIMKSKKILSLAMMTVSLSLTACSAKQDETAQLEEQIDRLEKQVQDLQNGSQDGLSQNASTSPENATKIPVTDDPEDSQHEENIPQQNTSDTPDITALHARIMDLEQQVKDTTPTGSAQEQREQFDHLKQEIESTEWDLDLLEDDLESQYQKGTIDRKEYRENDQTIEVLEDILDRCEDQLEIIFGIDD